MAVTLNTARSTTRGKGSRVVEFQVIGKVTPFDKNDKGEEIPVDKQTSKSDEVDYKGVVTTVPEAVELSGGVLQDMLDHFAAGYNEWSRSQAVEKDSFGNLLDGIDWKAVAAKAKIEDRESSVAADGTKVRAVNAVEVVQGQFKRMVRTMLQQAGDEETPENVKEAVDYLSRKMPKVNQAA